MCTHTHLLHAHFSAHSARTITFSHFHACAHTRTAQVSVKRFVACVSYLSISPSLSHVSPILAVPALSLRHHVPDHILAELSRPKSARHAQLRTSTEEFGYQSKSGLHTLHECVEHFIDCIDLYPLSFRFRLLPGVCGALSPAAPRGLLSPGFRRAIPLSAFPLITSLCHGPF